MHDRLDSLLTYLTSVPIVCPAGYSPMLRYDKNAKSTLEKMLDDTACDGDGVHTLCCPNYGSQHYCGWHTHNNGMISGS
jgi:chitinase